MLLEHKTVALADAKVSGDGTGSIEGYASVFGGVDSYGDTIDPGAYKDTLPDFLQSGFIAWGHDWNDPIATVKAAREDSRGLFLVGEFHSDPDAQKLRTRVAERIARGQAMGLSIGYEALEWEMRKVDTPVRDQWGEFTDKVRALTKIKLYEVSLVTVPADPAALVTGAKATYRDHADRVLDDVRDFLARSRDLSSLRAKEGRVLSEANRQKLRDLLDAFGSLDEVRTQIEELLASTEPQKQADASALYAAFLATQARLNGVAVPTA